MYVLKNTTQIHAPEILRKGVNITRKLVIKKQTNKH